MMINVKHHTDEEAATIIFNEYLRTMLIVR